MLKARRVFGLGEHGQRMHRLRLLRSREAGPADGREDQQKSRPDKLHPIVFLMTGACLVTVVSG
jgi:hypothetical protein